ncbi:unnamed protein product [Coccothraustes coccothraustes]
MLPGGGTGRARGVSLWAAGAPPPPELSSAPARAPPALPPCSPGHARTCGGAAGAERAGPREPRQSRGGGGGGAGTRTRRSLRSTHRAREGTSRRQVSTGGWCPPPPSGISARRGEVLGATGRGRALAGREGRAGWRRCSPASAGAFAPARSPPGRGAPAAPSGWGGVYCRLRPRFPPFASLLSRPSSPPASWRRAGARPGPELTLGRRGETRVRLLCPPAPLGRERKQSGAAGAIRRPAACRKLWRSRTGRSPSPAR